MAQTTYNVNCATASSPQLSNGDLLVFVTATHVVRIDVEYAKKFYMMHIGRDATVPSEPETSCMLQIKAGPHTEFLFEFPMHESTKALTWFHIIHELLNPEKKGLSPSSAKVVPSLSG